MSTNPYAPPTARVADVHAADARAGSMTPRQELKYLKLVLKQIDHGAPAVLRSRWVKAGVWLLVAAIIFIMLGGRVSLPTTVFTCFVAGALYGIYVIWHGSAKQWPSLCQHISRESVVERINELSR